MNEQVSDSWMAWLNMATYVIYDLADRLFSTWHGRYGEGKEAHVAFEKEMEL